MIDRSTELAQAAAELLTNVESDHPGGRIDDFVIVASVRDEDGEALIELTASDPRPWSQEALLQAGIDRIGEDGEEDDDEV